MSFSIYCTDSLFVLSNHIHTPAQRKVLSLGLKFVPTPTKINTKELVVDCKKFARRMRLKEFFHGKNYESELCSSQDINNPKFRSRGFRKMSDFTPNSNRDVHLDVYLKAVEHEVLNSKSRRVKSNLKKEERGAIKELRRNNDIVIFQAGKGGAVVIQNRADYIEAKRHLNLKDANGTPVYQSLQNPQIQDFNKRVQDAIDLATSNGVIEKEMSDILFIEDPKLEICIFYRKYTRRKHHHREDLYIIPGVL